MQIDCQQVDVVIIASTAGDLINVGLINVFFLRLQRWGGWAFCSAIFRGIWLAYGYWINQRRTSAVKNGNNPRLDHGHDA